MADRIRVSTECLEQCARTLESVSSVLEQTRHQLQSVDTDKCSGGDLYLKFSWASNVREAVKVLGTTMSAIQKNVEEISRAVSHTSELFADTENQISQNINALFEGKSHNAGNQTSPLGVSGQPLVFPSISLPKRLPSPQELIRQWMEKSAERRIEKANSATVYDESKHADREYGGNQSSPKTKKSEYDTYIEILERNRGIRLTEKQMETYLEKLETMACPYVALSNTVFQHYEGNAEGFERDYGFPMYKNGSLNYDQLIVEFYTKADNVTAVNNGTPVYNTTEDYGGLRSDGFKLFYNEFKDDSDRGVAPDNTLETRLNYCLGDKGTVTRYDRNDITVENYSQYAESGSVIISIAGANARIYDLNNNPINIGGHAMSIVGVEDGRYIVSSWGQKYYLDPDDNPATLIYDVVTFN